MKTKNIILLFILLHSGLSSFKTEPLNEFRITGFAQGTNYHITYYAREYKITKEQTDSILQSLDSSLSIYKPYSIISQFNQSENGIQIDSHLKTVLQRSLEIYKATQGISDITVYPLMQLWGFGTSNPGKDPSASEIANVLSCIGSKKIHLKNNFLSKDKPCTKIDINGIAQGYSVDVVAGYFDKMGVDDYIIEIGGEIKVRGKNQSTNKNFRIGIESPSENADDEPIINRILQIEKGAVTTSGNYRKFHESNGKKISHLMNPKTGYPLQNEMISVTVWAKDAITADGYDNALMGMGITKSFQFLKKHKELEAYFIYHDKNGAVKDTATGGFKKLLLPKK